MPSRLGSTITISFSLLTSTHGMPILSKRMTEGATAGMGIGIAVAAVLLLLVVIFLVIHFRRSSHISSINRERAILAGEKNADGSDKVDRGSTIDLIPMPNRARLASSQSGGGNRSSTLTLETGPDGQPIGGFRPWTASENSPRASFSSKRATRMMMMM
ncbi:hypothetical protein DV737_g5516, partial [Chaetothyriales sp. CBS 132003]